jgi:purine-binding chemotaxis protein CheW
VRTPVQSVAQIQIVTFRLGADEFGLDVFTVHEILRHQTVRSVPRAPAFVQGVIDVRGTLVPVIDLRTRFEVADAPDEDDPRIVVVQHGEDRLGLVVDAVTEVLRAPETALAEPPAYFRGLAAEYIRGIVRLPERLVIVLDIDRILTSQERIALEQADLAEHDGAGPGADDAGAAGRDAGA